MAEDFVTRDQHRADLAELRLELTNTLANLDKRTELIAQDLTALRRETEAWRADMRHEMDAWRADMRHEMDAWRADMRHEMGDLRQEMRREMGDLRQEMRDFRHTTQRQLWTMIGVVTFAVLTGVIKLVFFP